MATRPRTGLFTTMSAGYEREMSQDSMGSQGSGATDDLEPDDQQCLMGPWQPDAMVSRCAVCSRKFTLMRRRHHCRVCGLVVCDSCSRSRVVLPAAGSTWGGLTVARTLTRREVSGGMSGADVRVHDVRDEHKKRVCDRCMDDERRDAVTRAQAHAEGAAVAAKAVQRRQQRHGSAPEMPPRPTRSAPGAGGAGGRGPATSGLRRLTRTTSEPETAVVLRSGGSGSGDAAATVASLRAVAREAPRDEEPRGQSAQAGPPASVHGAGASSVPASPTLKRHWSAPELEPVVEEDARTRRASSDAHEATLAATTAPAVEDAGQQEASIRQDMPREDDGGSGMPVVAEDDEVGASVPEPAESSVASVAVASVARSAAPAVPEVDTSVAAAPAEPHGSAESEHGDEEEGEERKVQPDDEPAAAERVQTAANDAGPAVREASALDGRELRDAEPVPASETTETSPKPPVEGSAAEVPVSPVVAGADASVASDPVVAAPARSNTQTVYRESPTQTKREERVLTAADGTTAPSRRKRAVNSDSVATPATEAPVPAAAAMPVTTTTPATTTPATTTPVTTQSSPRSANVSATAGETAHGGVVSITAVLRDFVGVPGGFGMPSTGVGGLYARTESNFEALAVPYLAIFTCCVLQSTCTDALVLLLVLPVLVVHWLFVVGGGLSRWAPQVPVAVPGPLLFVVWLLVVFNSESARAGALPGAIIVALHALARKREAGEKRKSH